MKEYWPALPKMTWGIWKIFTRAFKFLKIRTFMTFICSKLKMYELKFYMGVMCHDNEEWCKIWKGIDLSVQNGHEEFDKFSPEHLKILKICTLMSYFWPKYVIFEIRSYRRVMFNSIQDWYKVWRNTDLHFQEWHKEFGKFSPEHSKFSKLGLSWHPFVQSWKCMSLNFT